MSLVDFLILSTATWRVTSVLVREDGPFLIFRKWREKIGISHDQDGNVFEIPETFMAGIFSCMWCCSIWVALLLVIFWSIIPPYTIIFALPFAISGVALLADKDG